MESEGSKGFGSESLEESFDARKARVILDMRSALNMALMEFDDDERLEAERALVLDLLKDFPEGLIPDPARRAERERLRGLFEKVDRLSQSVKPFVDALTSMA